MLPVERSLFLLGCYLVGSIPTGFVMAKVFVGIDIRQEGSHNIGATNVFRVVGIRAGILTLALDFLKGYFPIVLAGRFFPEENFLIIGAGLLAITGHMLPIFLKFRGGKGVATAAGVFLALLPMPTLMSLLVFVCAVLLWRRISLGSIAAALALPVATWLTKEPLVMVGLSSGISLLVVIRHIPNIKRLLQGEEKTITEFKEMRR